MAIVVHGIFSGKALEQINKSKLEAVVTSNTIPHSDKQVIFLFSFLLSFKLSSNNLII